MKPTKRAALIFSSCAAVLASAAAATYGCAPLTEASGDSATLDLVDRTEAGVARELAWANGAYGTGCTGQSGDWSLRISGDASMDNPPLTAVADDSGCSLTLTSLVGKQAFVAEPPLALGPSFSAYSSSFATGDGGAVAFYGYGAVSSPANGLVVTVLLSDSPGLPADGGDGGADGDAGGSAAATATSTTTDVDSPDYSLDLTSGALALALDSNDVVLSVTGYAVLVDGSIPGTSYYVDQGHLPANPTFADLDSAYAAATPTAITGASPQIAAASFGLTGATLTSPAARTIVVQRAVSGIPAYQALRITFSHG